MRLYEFDPYTGYQRLQRASPDFMDEVVEAQAIWSTEGDEADALRSGITQTIENTLIRYADDAGIREYENFLNLSYNGAEPDLDFRRATVAAAFIGHRHIGRPEILAMLDMFTGDTHGIDPPEVHFRFGTVMIDVFDTIADRERFLQMLIDKIPAHLGIQAIQHVRLPGHIVLGGIAQSLPVISNHNTPDAQSHAARTAAYTAGGAKSIRHVRSVNTPDPKERTGPIVLRTAGAAQARQYVYNNNAPPPNERAAHGAVRTAACSYAVSKIRSEGQMQA